MPDESRNGEALATAAASFAAEHGDALAYDLAHYCWRAAEELHASLAATVALPQGVRVADLFRVFLSLRATLELMAVEHRFGTAAHDGLLAAMLARYDRTVLERGSFTAWIAAAHETMRRSADPRDWLRLHAMALLGTRSPEDDVFHSALAYGLRAGPAIASVMEHHLAPDA